MGIEKIVNVAVGTVIGVGVTAGLYFGIGEPSYKKIRRDREFAQTYQQALFKYADTNQDGLVSGAEQDEFDKHLLSGKGVTCIHNQRPKYKDGSTVPTEVVTDWIIKYKPLE